MTSGFFFVRKKDITELRPCQDYKYLNNWTVKNGYPLPLVTDLLNKLKDAKYFTKPDIRAVTIIFGSEMEISGKLHPKPNMDPTNPWSCSLAFVIHQQHSSI